MKLCAGLRLSCQRLAHKVNNVCRSVSAIVALITPKAAVPLNQASNHAQYKQVKHNPKAGVLAKGLFTSLLMLSLGTKAGVALVEDLNISGNSSPSNLTVFNNQLFFSANNGSTGNELYRYDADSDKVVLAADIADGSDSSFPTELTVFNNQLFFSADDGIRHDELWVFTPSDTDGNVTAGAGADASTLSIALDSAGEALNIFDFTIIDGGGGDGLSLDVSQIVINVSGTSTDTQRGDITWRLNGPDASNVAGVYSAANDTITFSSLSLSVADGANETYTVNAFYNDVANASNGATIILSTDGDTDFTTSNTGFGSTTAVSHTVAILNSPPTLSKNNGAAVNESAVHTIKNTELLAADVDNTAAQLTFTVTTAPKVGQLFVDANDNGKADDGEAVTDGGTFTQDDINNNKVKYLQQSDQSTTSDSFVFSLVGGVTDTFNFTITLRDEKPTVDDIDDQTTKEDASYSYLLSGTDPEGQKVSFKLKSDAPSFLSVLQTETQVSTFAGYTGDFQESDGVNGVDVDAAGNVYIADSHNNAIKKVTPSGVVTVLAGSNSPSGYGSANGPGITATFYEPYDVAVDASDNVYVADTDNHLIRKISSSGVVTTLAGSVGDPGSDDGNETAAKFKNPNGIAVDTSGNVYVADSSNHLIRKITSDGVVTTLAGLAGVSGSVDGTKASARFTFPTGLEVDTAGNLYVADRYNHLIRKITSAGVVTTLAGSADDSGNVNATGKAAKFNQPSGVTVDSEGNLYVADRRNDLIRKITSDGVVTTLAGSGNFGSADGSAAVSEFRSPYGVAVDASGNVYVADGLNQRIRKIIPGGFKLSGTPAQNDVGEHNVCVIATDESNNETEQCFKLTVTDVNDAPTLSENNGATVSEATIHTLTKTELLAVDVDNTAAQLTFTVTTAPKVGQLFVDANGNDKADDGEAVTDGGTFTQDDIDKDKVKYLQQSDQSTTSDSFVFSLTDGMTGATPATNTFNFTITLRDEGPSIGDIDDQSTNEDALYSYLVNGTDPEGQKVSFKLKSSAPNWLTGTQQLESQVSKFFSIFSGFATTSHSDGVAVDKNGNIYVSDTYNHRILKITPDLVESTLAGSEGNPGSDNGSKTAAKFNNPSGIAVDAEGYVYVADRGNHLIRKISPSGVVSTLAGSDKGNVNNTGSLAKFDTPYDVAVGADGSVYVADEGNHLIRKITSGGVVTTLAGSADGSGFADGSKTAAKFDSPRSVALDTSGNIYVADKNNHRIRKITSLGVVTTLAGSDKGKVNGSGALAKFDNPSGVVLDALGNVYVADRGNALIRKIDKNKDVETWAGTGVAGELDGDASKASFRNPTSIAVDKSGNVFVTHQGTGDLGLTHLGVIRKITPAGFKLSGTPAQKDVGVHNVCVIATDENNNETEQCFKLTVTNVNDAPTLSENKGATVSEATVHTIEHTELLAVDVDNTAAQLTFTVTKAPGVGQLFVDANGNDKVDNGEAVDKNGTFSQDDINNNKVKYLQQSNQSTTSDSFVFSLTDGVTGTTPVTDTFNFTITLRDEAPKVDAVVDQTTYEDALYSYLINGSDPEGGAITLKLKANAPSWLKVSKNAPSVITTIAGNGEYIPVFKEPIEVEYKSQLGERLLSTPALGIQLNNPDGIALGKDGDVYIADTNFDRLLKVDANGSITVIAGKSGASSLGDGGLATEAKLDGPSSLVVDNRSNNSILYVADKNHHRIRKIDTATGIITTIAGEGTAASSGDNGPATLAKLDRPTGLALYTTEKETLLYIAEQSGNRIRKVNIDNNVITTVAGNGNSGFSGDGGDATLAELDEPTALALDSLGNLYIADFYNHRIRKLDTQTNIITTYAGIGGSGFSGDFGPAISAKLASPEGIIFDKADNLYISDSANHRIRKVSASTGNIETVVGTGLQGFAGDNGHPLSARLNRPARLILDEAYNLYIADSQNSRIRKVTPSGYTISGTPTNDDVGVHNVCVIATDENNNETEQCFKLTVTNVNDAPEANEQSVTTTQDTPSNITLTGSDVDVGDTLTFRVIDNPSNGQLSGTAPNLTYTPNSGYTGDDSFTFVVNDGTVDSPKEIVNITVNAGTTTPDPDPQPSNSAPVIDQGASQQVTTGRNAAIAIGLTATDADDDNLSWSIGSQAGNGSTSVSDGNVSYTPNTNFIGDDSFVVIVSDGQDSDSITINVTVTDANNAPTISGSPVTRVKVGESYQFTPSANDVDGDALTFSASGLPVWLSINTQTGVLSGTPSTAEIGTYGNIVVSVSDGNLSASLAAFSIEVVSDNTAPVVTGEALTTEEDTPVSTNLPQQDNDGDSLTYSLVTEPEHGSVEFTATGLTYTPAENFTGSDGFSVQASDGELVSEAAEFSVEVTPVNDAPVAEDDSLNADKVNNNTYTLDVLSNDSDPDGDTISISVANTAVGSVTVTNNQLVYQAPANFIGVVELGYSINDGHEGVDTATVTLTIAGNGNQEVFLTPPPTVNVDATGLFTSIDLGVAVAFDAQGNPLPVSLVDGGSILPPGKHTVYWQAGEGDNQVTAGQEVNVAPLISIGKDQTVSEGVSLAIPVILNGDSPTYPITVSYTVSGTADSNDHTLSSGSVTFEQGHEEIINLDIALDDEAETNETIVIALDSAMNLGANNTSVITVSEQNIAPEISLTVQQGGEERLTVAQDQGVVTVSATVTDANSQDVVTTQWTASSLTNLSDNDHRFVFDPSELTAGIYQVTLSAIDNGASALSNTSSVFIEVTQALAVLSDELDTDGDLIPDSQEGYADNDGDGIPDFKDAITDCNVMPERAIEQSKFLVEGEPGVCMRRGSISVLSDSDGLLVNSETNTASARLSGQNEKQSNAARVPDDAEVNRIGHVIDFILYDLPEEGASYAVALPQNKPLAVGAVYRKYNPEKGWFTFVEDEHNKLFSTQSEPGYCPPPGSELWQPGLNEGHWCVQLLIEDGGPNDNDGEVNGSIADPGVIAVLADANQLPIAQDDTAQTRINTPATFSVLANDSDADGDSLTVTSITANFGAVVINSDQSVTYTPQDKFVGQDTLVYGINDGNGGSDSASVTMTVKPNQVPILVDDAVTVIEGQSITIDVLSNDSDADGDSLTIISATVQTGTVVVNADQTLTYNSVEGQTGNVQIQYQVNDGFDTVSAIATVTVESKPLERVMVRNQGGGSMNVFLLFALLIMGALRPSLKRVKE